MFKVYFGLNGYAATEVIRSIFISVIRADSNMEFNVMRSI